MSFVQVLDVISPPYTSEFVQLFFPLIDSEDITGSLRTPGENDPVSEFIRKAFTFNYANHINYMESYVMVSIFIDVNIEKFS